MTKSIPFEDYCGLRLPPEIQIKRVKRVIAGELTEVQREVLTAYYFEQKTIPEIAAQRGVNKSTVCRTLHRAEAVIRRCLKY